MAVLNGWKMKKTSESICFWLTIALLTATGSIPCLAAELVYHSPAGVTFHVTDAGLSSIEFAGRQVASGGWSAANAENWFKDGGSQIVKSDPAGARSIEVLDDHRARVRQSNGDLVCTFDYTFDGEDVLISARIENNNAESAMNIVGFSGLTFHFDSLPDGMIPVQHISYFTAHGVAACHPGFWQPIGGTYAIDHSIGIGTSPWNTGRGDAGVVRTLTMWDYSDWNVDKRDRIPQRDLRYFVVSPVPARGAATFDFVIRVSPDRDWKHLLEKYREYFQKTYGPVQYKMDARWIATEYLNGGPPTISRQNPYGFRRRIDTLFGAEAFCDETIGALKQANGQGAIVWGQAGENPRGAMYRPDFDVLPPNVDFNWNIITRRYKQAGLKLGVATRPRDVVTTADWKTDQTIFINPDDPTNVQMLWQRYSNMIDHGFTLFYLDSFGDGFEDIKLMRFLRQKLGPNILTFCEHQTDAIMPFTGGYSETTFTAAANGQPGAYRLWSDEQNWEIYLWLCPGSQMAARFYHTQDGNPGPLDMGPDEWFFSRQITPLLPVDDFSRRLQGIMASQRKWVTNGQWRVDGSK
jgi:hypothetical protein